MAQVVNIPGVGRVNFPDDFTPEQIQAAIERDILPRARPSVPVETVAPEAPSLLARVGRGMMDIFQGIKQRSLQLDEALGGDPARPDLLAKAHAGPLSAGRTLDLPTAEQYTARVNDELALYERGRQAGAKPETLSELVTGADPGIDWARIGGGIAATAPLALVAPGSSILARAGSGALAGGAASGAQFTPSGKLSDTAVATAVGTAAGAVAGPIVGWTADKGLALARRLGGYVKGLRAGTASADELAQRIPELAELPPQARADLIAEAQAQIRRTGSLNAEQIARKANLLAQGVRPTKAMVTRDPADWTLERNLQKLAQSPDDELSRVGRELTDVYQANDAALTQRLLGMTEGLPQRTQEAHGLAVMRSLDDLSRASQADVSKVYEAVRREVGEELAFDGRSLHRTLDELQDNAYSEKLVASVRNRLRRMGVIDADNELTGEALTVSQAEELRKFVNTLPNDFGKRDIISAIDADVMRGHAVGNVFKRETLPKSLEWLRPDIDRVNALDAAYKAARARVKDAPTPEAKRLLQAQLRRDKAVLDEARDAVLERVPKRTGAGNHFEGARAAASERFAMLANPATQRALNTLGELSQGKTAQNFIKSQVIDAADQDVASLLSTLQKLPRDQSEAAINEIRAGVLQHLQDKAINPNSNRFSGAALNRAMKEIGEEKLLRIFGVSQYQQLRNLARAGIDATFDPAYSAVNYSGTAPMLLSLMRRARGTIGVPLPGVNEVAERGLERMAARSQLADVMAARATGELPQVPVSLQQLAARLPAASSPAVVAMLDAARKKSEKRAGNRQ